MLQAPLLPPGQQEPFEPLTPLGGQRLKLPLAHLSALLPLSPGERRLHLPPG